MYKLINFLLSDIFYFFIILLLIKISQAFYYKFSVNKNRITVITQNYLNTISHAILQFEDDIRSKYNNIVILPSSSINTGGFNYAAVHMSNDNYNFATFLLIFRSQKV